MLIRALKNLLQSRRNQLIIVILVTSLAYINILQNGFAWDDRDFLIDWPQIKSEQGLPAYLSVPALLAGDLPLNHRGVYRPLRSIYQLASYSLWGQNPLPYHIQAIIVHLLIVLTIYLTTELITKKSILAFIVSILFATHPIHTEAITYTAASMDSLGILFFFLSFYFYLKVEKEKFKKSTYLLASLIYAFLAFFTYEMTLVLPLLIILYDFYKSKFSYKNLLSRINIHKYYFLLLVVYVLIRIVILGVGNRATYLGSLWQTTSNQARVGFPEIVKDYIFWLTWPVNLTVSHIIPTNILYSYLYALHKIDPTAKLTSLSTNIVFLFPIFYIVATLIIIFIFFKKYPLIFFALSFFVVSLLSVANIFPQGAAIAERFLYIPSFGFCLLLGILIYYGISNFYKKKKYISYALILFFLVLISFYSFQTIKRNPAWKNEKSIWEATIRTDPENPLPYGALSIVYIREGQYDTAINLIKKALSLREPNATLNSDLGLTYEKKGDIEKAIEAHQKALKINPDYYMSHVYLGNIYLKQQNYDLAENEYKSAMEIKKDDPFILSYLGNVYYNQKKYDRALEIYIKAFNLNPSSDQISLNVGLAYFKLSKYAQAVAAFKKTLELNPNNRKAILGLREAESH